MATIREQIVAAMISALNAGSPPVVAERTRRAEIAESATLKAIVVRPVRAITEEITRPHSPLTRYRLTLDVEMWAAGTGTDRPDKVVDVLYEWVVAKLVGNTLGGLAHGITEGDSEFEFTDPGEYANVKLTTQMIVSYQNVASDATRQT